jgi:hypothetical protein
MSGPFLVLHRRPPVIGDTRQAHPDQQVRGEPFLINMAHVLRIEGLTTGSRLVIVPYNEKEPETIVVTETMTDILHLLGDDGRQAPERRKWATVPAMR